MTQTNASLLASFGLASTLTLADGSVLSSLSVVRHVPNRRCVCRGNWQGKPVYVKLFFGEQAKRYAERDINGVQHFQQANILTPQILASAELTQPAGYAVIFEEVVNAENAETLLLALTEHQQVALAKQLMQVLAAHHAAGLLQTDMYLKNFLVQEESVYSIDGDGVRSYGAITNGKALANLCRLLSKFDVLMLEKHLPNLLAVYAQARSWVVAPSVDDAKAGIDRARRKATSAYADKKVFRQCTDVDVSKTAASFLAVNSAYHATDLPKTVEAANACFSADNMLKEGKTCTVARSQFGELDIVLKRYNIKGFWHGLNRAMRQTRAAASWSNAHRLQLLGIPTPLPIALIEERRFSYLRGTAFFLSHYADKPDINIFFEKTTDKQLRSSAVRQTVELFYRLYLLKLSHGDMKQTNIKMLDSGEPLMIDLDSMQQHQWSYFAKKAHAKDLKRFMRNWHDQPSLYNAFVKVFKVVYADHAPLQAAQILE